MRHLLLATALALALPAIAQTKAQEKHVQSIVAKAGALTVDNCEINDGTKGWLYPNDEPVGKLPVYRCFAHGYRAIATFTQSAEGSGSREIVEYCTFTEVSKSCETVTANRPKHRSADLAQFGVKELQMEEGQSSASKR
jgi:hypothetical protein